jgi:hypothetical protein
MYKVNLKESLFPEQKDAELWDITVSFNQQYNASN